MLKMDQVHVLRHKVLKEGQSIRRVAREIGLSRNTVAQLSLLHEVHNRDKFEDLVPDLLDTIRAASGNAMTPQANNQDPNQPYEIQFAAEGRAFTAADCKKANAALIQRVMGPLKAKLGPHDKLEEAGISIDPEAPANVPNNAELVGYRAENSLVVETSSFDQIGPSIDAAVAAGATQLGQLTFALRDDTKVRSDALVAASNDAQMRVQTVAPLWE